MPALPRAGAAITGKRGPSRCLALLLAAAALAGAPAAARAAAPSDAEIVGLILEDFKEPPLSPAQKAAVERFVHDADPAHKLLLPDFLTQHLDAEAKRRFLAAAPAGSPASKDFYARTVSALNAALGDRGYAMPLEPLRDLPALPAELDTPHIRLMAKAERETDPRERVRILTEAIAAVSTSDLRMAGAVAHFERGTARFELHDIQGAFDDVNADLALYPTHAKGVYIRAALELMLKRWQDAVRDATALLAYTPDFPFAYVFRGYAYGEMGAHAAALRDFDKALRLEPANVWALLSRADEEDRTGHAEAAAIDYDLAIRLSTRPAMAYEGLGFAYLDMGRSEAAAAAFERTVQLDPSDTSAFAGLAIARLRLHDEPQALAEYSRAVAAEPLFDVSAASLTAVGSRWMKGPDGGDGLQFYRFTPRTAADIDALIGLRRKTRETHAPGRP